MDGDGIWGWHDMTLNRATDGVVVRCWTKDVGNLAGASFNLTMGYHFYNKNEVYQFCFC